MSRTSQFVTTACVAILGIHTVLASGKEAILLRRGGMSVIGELLALRDSALVINVQRDASESDLQSQHGLIKVIRYSLISKITIEGHSNTLIGAAGGLAIGVLSGVAIGIGSTNPQNNIQTFGLTGISDAVGGAAIGGLVGLAGGLIIGSAASSRGVELDFSKKWDPTVLKPYARFPDQEPEYLRAIN